MKKLFAEFMNFASHNTGIVVGQLLCFAILLYAHGCESKVPSIINPAQRISRGELQVEVDSFIAIASLRFKDLDKQDAFKKTLFEQVSLWAQGGAINPTGLMMMLFGIIGTGATVDNVTKRRRENNALRRYTDKVIENNKKVTDP